MTKDIRQEIVEEFDELTPGLTNGLNSADRMIIKNWLALRLSRLEAATERRVVEEIREKGFIIGVREGNAFKEASPEEVTRALLLSKPHQTLT